ncbi:MAG: alanine--tRNA ligase [Elusimicrobiota bacterium]
MQSYEIRKKFLEFFARQGHPVIPSSPLIPQGDPSLLFTSAGMVQFKPYYLGLKTDMKRAASCQKCFRTTDIDNVGRTIRHLTFFEMLGNFSFGDYFKEESLKWGYEFLSREMGLDPKRMYFSIYRGGVAPKDEEAVAIWKKILPSELHSHIFEMGEDNFWSMGDTGPSGPCSEIYFDRGEKYGCQKPDCAPGCSCDRYIEIWNHVFTQFDRQPDGSFNPLPKKNIDTGMGLERLAFIVEGKYSPFETSLFYPIAEAFLKLNPSVKYDFNSPDISAFRIISDHLRGACFLISEGVLPSNEGRGYILRRLIRRAQRFGMVAGIKGAFLWKLTGSVREIFKDTYPQLEKNERHIVSALKYEEDGFLETLEKGEKYLNDLMEKNSAGISGRDAFRLYETYGFPLELTREIAAKKSLAVDEKGFEEAKKQAQEIARSAWKSSGEQNAFIFQKAEEKLPQTVFTGYDSLCEESKLLAIVDAQGNILEKAESGFCWLAFDKTPFYAESGGQVGDSGLVLKNGGKAAEILDTQKPAGGVFFHKAKILSSVKTGETLRLEVDALRRKKIAANHTSVHLINSALRKVFGDSVRQAGSLVNEEKFRFDYTITKTPSAQELEEVERIANEAIMAGYRVFKEVRPLADAEKLGATVLVGEKYSDPARFVLINRDGFKEGAEKYSLELCGGTHTDEMKDIFSIRILKDSSVSRGIRRIEGSSGYALLDYLNSLSSSAISAARDLSCQPEELEARIARLRADEKALKEEIKRLKTSKTASSSVEKIKLNEKMSLVAQDAGDFDIKILREFSDRLRNEEKNAWIFVYARREDKINFTLSLTADIQDASADAGAVARKFSEKISGRAGGRRDFAQGGGVLAKDISELIKDLAESLK